MIDIWSIVFVIAFIFTICMQLLILSLHNNPIKCIKIFTKKLFCNKKIFGIIFNIPIFIISIPAITLVILTSSIMMEDEK